jgi:hypothetical protein
MKLDPYLSPCTKISSKWIKDLNVRPESLKFLMKNTGEILQEIGTSNNVLGYQYLRE